MKKCCSQSFATGIFVGVKNIHIFEETLTLLLPCRTDAACLPAARGDTGADWDPMLRSSAPCSTCPFWTRFYCSASPFSSKNQLVASDFSPWFWWGVNNPKERALVVFQRKLLSDGKDCVCNWEAVEGLMGAGLGKSRNSPKLKQFRRAPNRHHAEV